MSWIQTYTGQQFDPYKPDPDKINIKDIAHALSNLCRFNGHCKKFYSIAQHSILVSSYCSGENRLWGLLHDASEAYISDICSPIKHTIRGYTELEAGIMDVICKKYNLPVKMPKEVKENDILLLVLEKQTLFDIDLNWNLPKAVKDDFDTIIPWSPDIAEKCFLDAFYLLMENKSRNMWGNVC